MDNELEEWRDVKGFEGAYKVSNLGRIMSLKSGKQKVLSQVNKRGEYFSVILRYGRKTLSTRIHRLVYETFVGEIPKGHKFHIHHINHNKQDNRVENLKLVTSKEHYYEDIETRNTKAMNYYNQYIRSLKVSQYTLEGKFIKTYINARIAGKETGVCARNILQVAKKEPYNNKGSIRKQAGGFIWKLAG